MFDQKRRACVVKTSAKLKCASLDREKANYKGDGQRKKLTACNFNIDFIVNKIVLGLLGKKILRLAAVTFHH